MDNATLLAMEYPEDAKALEVQDVSPDRLQIYESVVNGISKGGEVKAVVCECYGDKVQHLVKDGKVVMVEEGCKIMLEDLSPSQMVEYRFKESPQWMLGWMSAEAAIGYRAQKFKTWKEMLDSPNCEAAFKRLIQTGLVTKLYDTVALATPAEEADKWVVTNEETGKKIDIPHPVSEMRIWDAEAGAYKELSPHLDGAPSDAEADAYWAKLLDEQREKHGAEFVDKMLA
eukprot:TRINITY_DN120_c4_g1_i1.p1 TRINITY_DN120_c4_g1~~TRINITY_DN120_c4_g1_i1.p1  ORF type:complete len:247 (+),score=74.56 TRINITY_DN120_c4_g1_i1:56-742(+)